MRVRISEIFYSLQGESTRIGLPCVFIRLAGCNLRCVYCDTLYAHEEGADFALEAILSQVAGFHCPLVCVTGGEPLAVEGTGDLLTSLKENGYKVLLETNGTLPLHGLPEGISIIMDIKCPSSGFSDKVRWENLDALSPADEIKFVISTEEDYLWATGVLHKYNIAQRHPVLFSPAAPLMDMRQLAEWILRDKLPVRLQPQLHKIIWGAETRGK